MNDDQDFVTVGRFERRMAEVEGQLRLEIGELRHDMIDGFGKLRTEMADRNADLLKWLLGFFVAQTGVLVAMLTFFR